MIFKSGLLGICVTLSSFSLFAQGAPVPHVFTQGDPVISSEFNANFQELSNRNATTQTDVDQNATEITGIQSSVSTIEGTVTQIQSDVTNLQTSNGMPLLQFVGNSTGTVDGQQGIRVMTELCQVDYPGSRVCTTEEYAKTTNFPAAIPDTTWAWIMPSKLVGSAISTSAVVSDTFSGQSAIVQRLSCDGWRNGQNGTAVSGVGEFIGFNCLSPIPVSCCN